MNRKTLLFCGFILVMPSLFAFQSRKKVQDGGDAALKRQQELLKQYEKAEADAAEEIRQTELRIQEEKRLEQERIERERRLEEERLEEEKRKEEERIKKEEEEAERLRLEQLEKERQAKELQEKQEKERQAELEKQMEEALEKEKQKNTNVRNHKEYLSEYLLQDEFITEEVEEPEDIIPQPDERDAAGRTLLMNAAKEGDELFLKKLLENGADVNLSDSEGWNALMYAVRYSEKIKSVNLLIDAGTDIKKQTRYGLSALSIAACYNNNPKILSAILKKYIPSDKEVLRSFVFLLSEQNITAEAQLSKTQVFLDTGLPVNILYEGKTPLMYAAAYGNSTEIIKLLLDSGANLSLRSSEGKTAFDYASKNKNLEHDQIYWALNEN